MKKNLMKRIFAVALTGTMMTGLLAGCGSDKKEATGGTETKTETKAETETTDTAADSGKPDTWIADRTITVQAYVDDIGASLPKDFNNTPAMQELTKRTGIKLNIQYTPGDSDSKVMASQLAAGTIPDVIISYLDNSTRPEFPLILKAAKEGMFADISSFLPNTKVFSKFSEEGFLPSDSYKNVVFREDFNGAVYLWQMAVDDEDRSMVFNPDDSYIGGPYIQKAIADKLGVDVTKVNTTEQFYDLLVQIKEGGFKDDNGNAVWPLGPKYWGGSVDALRWNINDLNWGVSDNYNMDADGNIFHEVETDYVYDKINYVRKLLDEGLMNPEYFTMDGTRAEEVSKTKNSAIIGDVHNYQEIIYSSEDWIPVGPINDIQGDNKTVTSGKTARGCMAISAEAENPEEIVKFFDYLSTPEGQLLAEYGVEGVSYSLVDGFPVLTDEVLEKLNSGDTDWLINNVGSSFGGAANYFFEFVLTNMNSTKYFGESRPGASASTTFARSVELAKTYPREMKLVKGLKATAYLATPGLENVKTQMDLLNYNEVLTQAFYAKSDEEVKKIVESFRAQLKAAGIDEFKAVLKELYTADPDSINFYN